MLGLAERVESLLAQLAAHAALPHAAKRRGVVVGERIVDPERAGLDFLHRLERPGQVARVDVRAETELRSRGERNRFVGVPDHLNRRNRPEHFFAHDGVRRLHVGQHGRARRTSLARRPPAGRRQTEASRLRLRARRTCSSTRSRARSEMSGPRSVSGSNPLPSFSDRVCSTNRSTNALAIGSTT